MCARGPAKSPCGAAPAVHSWDVLFGWISAASRMYLRCRIRVDFDHEYRVRRHRQHMPDDRVRRGQFLCGWVSTAGSLYLCPRLPVYVDHQHRLRG